MAKNKFKRSRLTFDLSALRSLILKSHQYYYIVFSQTIGPTELKFHVKTLYDKLAKMYANYFCHTTKMAARPIYGKNPLKSSPEPEGR